jgi:hypothetical protein
VRNRVLPTEKGVSGEAGHKDILFYIPLSKPIDYIEGFEEAVTEALKKSSSAVALTDVKVKRSILITFLYNEWCIVIEGAPVSKVP